MKILRIVHGLANNVADLEVPDDFNINLWRLQVVEASGAFAASGPMPIWINLPWIQHAVVMTHEQASAAYRQGATVQ